MLSWETSIAFIFADLRSAIVNFQTENGNTLQPLLIFCYTIDPSNRSTEKLQFFCCLFVFICLLLEATTIGSDHQTRFKNIISHCFRFWSNQRQYQCNTVSCYWLWINISNWWSVSWEHFDRRRYAQLFVEQTPPQIHLLAETQNAPTLCESQCSSCHLCSFGWPLLWTLLP